MDIPTVGLSVACQPYPISLKYQNFVDEEIKLLENAGCISKGLSLWATSVIIVSKKPDPTNPCKQNLCLVLYYRSLNKSINTAHYCNCVISYYPLPNITGLLARLQNCTIFSSLDLRSNDHHTGLTPEAKPNTAFAQQVVNGTWMWLLSGYTYSWVFSVNLCHRSCQDEIFASLILMTY